MTALIVVRHDQDWAGFVIVVATVLLAVAADWAIGRVLLWWDTRANRLALQSLRAVAAERCPGCGCPVRADHVLDGGECRELQVERRVRAEVRAREWSA